MDELILGGNQDIQHPISGLEGIGALGNSFPMNVTGLSSQKLLALVGERLLHPSQYQLDARAVMDYTPNTVLKIISTVNQAIDSTKNTLTELANNTQIDDIFGVSFGVNYNHSIADKLLNKFTQNNFTEAPNVELILGETFNGAYANENNTIYLSQEFVLHNLENIDAIKGVLLEEFGHYLDSKINVRDAAGDEGDIFSRLVRGQSISVEELSALKIEDDHTNILLNGKVISIEQQKIDGDSGNNTLYGTKYEDKIYGNNGNDSVYANSGNDLIYGGNNDDKLWGEDGNDELRGDDGNDELRGGGNDDKLWGGNQNDKLWGEEGNDQLVGDSGNDELNGGNGDDKLWGSGNDDKLWGEKGNDQLIGDDGNDILNGYGFSDNERDTLSGGTGSDHFLLGDVSNVFYAKNGDSDYAVISDFNRGEDVIHLKKLGLTKSNSNQAYGYRLVTVGSNTQIRIDSSNELVAILQNITGVSLTGKEFYFEGGNSSPTIYQDANFAGQTKTFTPGDYDSLLTFSNGSGGNWNDFISSLDIPEGWVVEAYKDINFQGEKLVLNSSTSYVGSDWNDKISSLKVYQAPTIYEHDKFGGNARTLAAGEYNGLPWNTGSGRDWNDIISSIEIPKGWVVEAYEHINFGGQKLVLNSSTSYVGNDWNDKISSLKVYRSSLQAIPNYKYSDTDYLNTLYQDKDKNALSRKVHDGTIAFDSVDGDTDGKVYALVGGEVIEAKNGKKITDWRYNGTIAVYNKDLNKTFIYWHFGEGSINESMKGKTIEAGSLIGLEGDTGLSTGIHTHVQVHEGRETVDMSKGIAPDKSKRLNLADVFQEAVRKGLVKLYT